MSNHPASVPFLSIGFRPFFFFGILFSCISGALWTLFWSPLEPLQWSTHWQPMGGMMFWHAHEMIMGFVFAIISGFLLTAVQNWTGLRTTTPLTLSLLLLSWLAARIAFLLSDLLEPWLLITVQVTPIFALMMAIGTPIVLAKMWRNLFVVAALLLLAINEIRLLMNLDNGVLNHQLLIAQIFIILLYISMIAGRVLPFFMASRLGIAKTQEPKPLFLSCTLPLVLLCLNLSFYGSKLISISLLLVLAAAHSLRIRNWYTDKVWQEPMLYSLFISYVSLPLGFFLIAINESFQLGWANTPLHILTLGSMGGLIIAMVGRVSLGHTGRKIQAVSAIKIALILIVLAFIFRVIVPMGFDWHPAFMAISGLSWTLAFASLFIYFAKIWVQPRPDGR